MSHDPHHRNSDDWLKAVRKIRQKLAEKSTRNRERIKVLEDAVARYEKGIETIDLVCETASQMAHERETSNV